MRIKELGSHLTQIIKWPVVFPVNCYLVQEEDGNFPFLFLPVELNAPEKSSGASPPLLEILFRNGLDMREVGSGPGRQGYVAGII